MSDEIIESIMEYPVLNMFDVRDKDNTYWSNSPAQI